MEVAASQEDHEVCARSCQSLAFKCQPLCSPVFVTWRDYTLPWDYGRPYGAQEWYHRANRSSKRTERARGAPLFASQ